MQTWAMMAISASILWGFSYAISEKILNIGVGPFMLVLFSALVVAPFYFFAAWSTGQFHESWNALMQKPNFLGLLVLFSVCIFTANYLIFHAISLKNATTVNLIEISYPLFTAFFSFLLFRETQLTGWTVFGGFLVLSGLSIIMLKN